VFRKLLLLSSLVLVGGCTWPVRDATDQTVRDLVEHPWDVAPEPGPEPARPSAEAPATGLASPPPAELHTSDRTSPGAPSSGDLGLVRVSEAPAKVQTVAWTGSQADPARRVVRLKDDEVLAAAWTQPGPDGPGRKLDLEISPRLPGSEVPRTVLPGDRAAVESAIDRIYPEVPPLPVEPEVQPGPAGKPYTLADLQRLAAENSPTLRQAASDVQSARGAVIQAMTYPNPVGGYAQQPSNNNNTPGVEGGAIDQVIVTGGKIKLGSAAAQKDLDNANLALKRARTDLATAVRNAYFTLLVDVETLAVTRALAQLSDEIYRLQIGLLRGAQAAPYEPAALGAQTYVNRLAYKQAIASYIYDWKALVATLGLPQLPLSQVAGQVDRFIPYYDYDDVRAHVLQNHTDILTARNVVKKSQYILKLAQVTPVVPNLDVNMFLGKDFGNPPHGTYQTLALGFPAPVWDQNKGNIIAAQGALVRASEESHRVEVTLTNNLALAYEGYRNNLYAMEAYRRNILPDLVRYYRGIYERRQIDPRSAFGDLVFAQQNLSTNVTAYIDLLQSLWTSVVGVADYLQTDDLYQLGGRRELPALPDFKQLQPPHWECGHDTVATPVATGVAEDTLPVHGGWVQNDGSLVGVGDKGVGKSYWASLPASQSPLPTDRPASTKPSSAGGSEKVAAGRNGLAKDQQVQTVAGTQVQPGPGGAGPSGRKLDFEISPRLPGSEAPRISLPKEMTQEERDRAINRVFPELPPLPIEPKVQPGPGGKPYTLADFQRLAVENSPTLRQAASDVEAAKGNLVQAMTYPNPTFAYVLASSNNNNTGNSVGGFIDQAMIMGGKQKLGSAAAQMALDNANLALKRARMDLATAVRNGYYTLLVDIETLVVTRALAQFSDEIYRLQIGLLRGAQAAPYEPTALGAQTYMNRLAYKQAIASYIYDWKALVATLGLSQLPLSEVSGSVDRLIPYYDFDEVRGYTLQNHTDILTARNGVKIAQYNLKLNQITPVFPDFDVNLAMQKDFSNPPFGQYQTISLGFPAPIWDQNKGNIIAAQAALVRAAEESHRVEVTLTNGLALAYEGYRNNLYAMEYYRRNILPDLVRYYRGVFARRQIDPSSAFGDLVFAQQNLSTNVTSYLGILRSLWTSVVSVADYLQTDDLYQLAGRRELPQLPDFTRLPQWACGHESVSAPTMEGAVLSGPGVSDPGVGLPAAGPAAGVAVPPGGKASLPVGETDPRAGAGGVSPLPPRVVEPSAALRPSKPTDRPPMPPGAPADGATTWLGRGRVRVIDPAALMKSYFGEETNDEVQGC
jgi:outer membrane protein, heavy metal efflux system